MDKSQAMFQLMEQYEQSGQNRVHFCAQAGISLSKFGYWRSRWLGAQRNSEPQNPPFVAFESSAIPLPVACELIYPSGICVQFPAIDVSVLQQLLDV
ncbi:MAG: hypothetical protein NW226_17345 [Microscillaceae bacterium]|nr:hypothetical protein [Microscillaceae bacterium]